MSDAGQRRFSSPVWRWITVTILVLEILLIAVTWLFIASEIALRSVTNTSGVQVVLAVLFLTLIGFWGIAAWDVLNKPLPFRLGSAAAVLVMALHLFAGLSVLVSLGFAAGPTESWVESSPNVDTNTAAYAVGYISSQVMVVIGTALIVPGMIPSLKRLFSTGMQEQ